MERISVMGIDLAKNIFHLYGRTEGGKCVLRKKVNRGKLLEELAVLSECTVGMEACGSSHYWAREIAKLGHRVRQIAPQYVKPCKSSAFPTFSNF